MKKINIVIYILCFIFALNINVFGMEYGDLDENGILTATDAAYALQKALDNKFVLPIENNTENNISQKKALTVYFSRVGNTDYADDIDAITSASIINNSDKRTGTTEAVADIIRSKVGGDKLLIETSEKYSEDFQEVVDKNHTEQNENYLPPLKTKINNINEYDVIFIGYPVWAITVPAPVKSFLSEYNLSGKTIVPFCTHDGYGSGNSFNVIKNNCPDSDILDGIAVNSDNVVNGDINDLSNDIDKWLDNIDIFSVLSAENEVPVSITIGEHKLSGVLNNTNEAKEFIKMLPVTVSMHGYGGREYYGEINDRISTEGHGNLSFENGDITYCPTNYTVAIFYSQTNNPNLTMEVYKMGKVTSDLSVFENLENNIDVRFELRSNSPADVDCDGKITANDAAEILRKVLDRSHIMPIETATTEITTENTTETTTETSTESTTETTTEDTTEAANDTLVVYFSASRGKNTKGIAESISDILKADIYEIIPEVPYTDEDLDYGDSSSRTTIEMNDPNSRPTISGSVENMDKYSVIFVGYPIWWGEAPRILSTFMESYNFSGKTIVPFCTSGSSGIGSSATNLQKLTNEANWLSGHRFSSSESRENIENWIDGLEINKK